MIGQTISHYRILEHVGSGGMGVVYRARDERLERDVALKVLPPGTLRDPAARKRFFKEALALSRLNHPNIETVHDFDTQGDVDFLVMEYIHGATLDKQLAGGGLSEKEISRLGVQMAEGLAAAHKQGVVHCDLKPRNLSITEDGRVKILDFGLAKLLQPVSEATATASLTGAGSAGGTIPYMSPEQLRSEKIDARSDIWAAGAVLYEMATGQRAFNELMAGQLVEAILHRAPTRPQALNPNVSGELERIILKCLEKDPEDRYQSAKEIAVDLRRMTEPSATSVRLVPGRNRRRVRAPRLRWGLAALAVLLLGAGWVGLRPAFFQSRHSIAVLPFVDESQDASSSQYISDGITEGVIDKLSEMPSLKVTSRNSVFRFKGKQVDAQAAGRDLRVEEVLAGRIARDANGLTVSAELINVSDGSRIWGRQLRYSNSELSRVQDDLAMSVTEKLHLSGAEETRLTRRATDNAGAYQAYLQARFYLNQRTPPGIRKSIELFQQATETDPNFALAYAGLADAYNLGAALGILAPRESSPEAKAAATRALILDPQLGEAHAALGLVKSHYDYDFPGAETEFEKAIKFNPNYANARLFYAGGYLTPMGRHAEAIAEMKKALELDPLSLPLHNLMGNTYRWARDFGRAVQEFRSTIELDPAFPLTHWFFASCLEDMGKYQEAIAEWQKGEILAGTPPEEAEAEARDFRQALASGGAKGYWQKKLELALKEQAQAGGQYFPALQLAGDYARVGDRDKAFEWLEKSYAERDGNITLIKSLPAFDGLRNDPRFTELLRRMKLPG